MTDTDIQANADRAHADSVAMTAAVTAQTAVITAALEVQKQILAAWQAEEPPTRIGVSDAQDLIKAIADAIKEQKP